MCSRLYGDQGVIASVNRRRGVEREFVKTMTLHVARRVLFLSLQNLHVLVGLKPTQRHIHIASPTLMAYRRAVRRLKLHTG